jgi:DNA repair protein RadC
VLFLDVKNRLIDAKEMFRGTLTIPRSTRARWSRKRWRAMPPACCWPTTTRRHARPSESDLLLTRALMQALALVDIRILDHFVVAGQQIHLVCRAWPTLGLPYALRVYARIHNC